MATTIKNRDSIFLGLGKLYIGDCSSNISYTTPVLDSSHYIVAQAEIGFTAERKFVQEFTYSTTAGSLLLKRAVSLGASFVLNVTLLELTAKNLSYSFGGDGSSGNILNDIVSQPVELRAEVVFTFPNKVNTMKIILPRNIITTEFISLNFQNEDAVNIPISINSVHADNSSWVDDPYGKFIFA